MKKILFSILAISILFFSACKKNDDNPTNPVETPDGYTLVWSDEFDSLGINATNWNYQTGDGTNHGLPAGWGNDEKQIYTNNSDNSAIVMEDGFSVLAITALEDNTSGYTSARLTTKDKRSMRFGRIDVKAKMPEGQGLWPAIWMLGDNVDEIVWPGCGEIDIAEVLGHQTSSLHTTIHFTNSEKKHEENKKVHELQNSAFNTDFHIFSLDWNPESLTFLLDGQQVSQVTIEDDMKEFLRNFYIILNVAVGGTLPGDPDATTVFPQTMYVDYVRVFSKDGLQIPDVPVLDIDEETVGQIINESIGDNAIKDGFNELGKLNVIAYGPGEPEVLTSTTAIDGDSSLVFNFPGGNWGGAYIELETVKDLSSYSHLKFSLNKPAAMINAEIKLESPPTSAIIFLEDYSGTLVDKDFIEYTIPLSDFAGLNLNELTIPFAIWNPQDADQEFVAATVLIDNVYFSN